MERARRIELNMGDTNYKIFLELQKQNRKLINIENMLENKLDQMIRILEKIHGPGRFE